MDDVAADYAELVADLYATLLAAKMDGAVGMRVEEAGGPRVEAGGQNPLRRFAPPPPRRAVGEEEIKPASRVQRPASGLPPPASPLQPPASGLQPPPSGLLGKWAAVLADPAQQLAELRKELGERCSGCGGAVPYGEGPARPRLVVLAAPIAGAAGAMFANMLVKVLNLEPSDAFVLPAPGCGACRDAVRRQVEIVRARLVLAMGKEALGIVGGVAGGWSRWAGADALVTFHPDEILQDAARKRPAFEHLQSLARRL